MREEIGSFVNPLGAPLREPGIGAFVEKVENEENDCRNYADFQIIPETAPTAFGLVVFFVIMRQRHWCFQNVGKRVEQGITNGTHLALMDKTKHNEERSDVRELGDAGIEDDHKHPGNERPRPGYPSLSGIQALRMKIKRKAAQQRTEK